MKYKINTNDKATSDIFLRCLWGQLREEFDNFGWNYWGTIENNVVDLGLLCLGLETPVHISYNYKKKGTIDYIFIELDSLKNSSEIEKIISQCISKARMGIKLIKTGCFSVPVFSYYEIDSFSGSFFKIVKSESGSHLAISVEYFDSVDLKQEFAIRSSDLIKFLSLAFMVPIYHGKSKQDEIKRRTLCSSDELNIIDGFMGKCEPHSHVYNKVLEAVTLYNNALKIIYINKSTKVAEIVESGPGDFELYIPENHNKILELHQQVSIDTEIAIVSLISSVEVVATSDKNESKACASCGQQVYKISKRVMDFSKKFGDEVISKNIKQAYAIRSQIVHVGILLERNETYQGVTNPRIDFSQAGSLLKHTNSLPEILLDDIRTVLFNFIKSQIG